MMAKVVIIAEQSTGYFLSHFVLFILCDKEVWNKGFVMLAAGARSIVSLP
jgi:hypothetical protein